MNKKKVLCIFLDSIFLIIFNIVFFVLKCYKINLSVWISYGFIHFSYIMLTMTPFFVKKNKKMDNLCLSLYITSLTYFLITFIVGLLFIFFHFDNYKMIFVIQVIIGGIYAVLFLFNMIANEHTMENIEKQEDEITYIKYCSNRLKEIMNRVDNKIVNKKIEKVYDLIHSSQMKSGIKVKEYEIRVIDLIEDLDSKIKENDSEENIDLIIKRIINVANKRNNILKYRN